MQCSKNGWVSHWYDSPTACNRSLNFHSLSHSLIEHPLRWMITADNLYNKRRYVCLSVCLSVCIYVPYGRPNGWADRDQTGHTHSCPSRECFCQGQCQGHSCMRAGVTELRNIRNAARKSTPSERCSNYVRRTGEATPGERLRNSVRTTGNYSSSNEARRRRCRAASAEGASRTPSGGRVITASHYIMRRLLEFLSVAFFPRYLSITVQFMPSRIFGPGRRVPKSHSSCSSCCCYQFSKNP